MNPPGPMERRYIMAQAFCAFADPLHPAWGGRRVLYVLRHSWLHPPRRGRIEPGSLKVVVHTDFMTEEFNYGSYAEMAKEWGPDPNQEMIP